MALAEARKRMAAASACSRRGAKIDTGTCQTCQGVVNVDILACSLHGRCVVDKVVTGCKTCTQCADKDGGGANGNGAAANHIADVRKMVTTSAKFAAPVTRESIAMDHFHRQSKLSLAVMSGAEVTKIGLPGGRFNASVIEWRGRILMVARTTWGGSRLELYELDEISLQPSLIGKLAIDSDVAGMGHEDPRFFELSGKLHISFTGYNGATTDVLYAELDDSLHVKHLWKPNLAGRRRGEKNWGFFEGADGLCAVYTIVPHVVAKVDGDWITRAFIVNSPMHWMGGEHRGGASPVRIGDEFYSFFHGTLLLPGDVTHTYTCGVYTFDAKPPYAPLRFAKTPVIWPRERIVPKSIVFPCGAMRHGDDWLISYGYQDSSVEILRIKQSIIEAALVAI